MFMWFMVMVMSSRALWVFDVNAVIMVRVSLVTWLYVNVAIVMDILFIWLYVYVVRS